MRIVRVETLKSCGEYSRSTHWTETRQRMHECITRIAWPPGSDKFTIYPESGKKRGEGNGVKPIKDGMMRELESIGWILEHRVLNPMGLVVGDFDAVLKGPEGPVALEWETGNISSSHRSLNKMSMFLMKGLLAAGTLVVPSRDMYRFLTDRIGNVQELEGYFDFWRSLPCEAGILEIVVIEHDATSFDVPRIPKGTDGRAAG
ncbi:restriction endonuclease [Nostoc sp. NIES-2111]